MTMDRGCAVLDHAEPVDPDQLRVGETYFSVTFIDEQMLVPQMRPLVYIGKGVPPARRHQFVFQDAPSYNAGIDPKSPPEDWNVEFHAYTKSSVSSVYAFDAALNVLDRCARRRRKLSQLRA